MADDNEDVVTAELVPYGDIEQALLTPGVAIEDTPTDAARQIVQDILDATTAEEVLTEAEVIHARDIIDEPFVALSVRLLNSAYDGEGIAIYAVIEAADDAGEPMIITCGARNVVAQLWQLSRLNSLPRRVKIVERGKARNGKSAPMRLIDATDKKPAKSA